MPFPCAPSSQRYKPSAGEKVTGWATCKLRTFRIFVKWLRRLCPNGAQKRSAQPAEQPVRRAWLASGRRHKPSIADDLRRKGRPKVMIAKILATPGLYQNFRMVLRGPQVFERLRYALY